MPSLLIHPRPSTNARLPRSACVGGSRTSDSLSVMCAKALSAHPDGDLELPTHGSDVLPVHPSGSAPSNLTYNA